MEFGVRFDGADATDMTSIPVVLEVYGRTIPRNYREALKGLKVDDPGTLMIRPERMK